MTFLNLFICGNRNENPAAALKCAGFMKIHLSQTGQLGTFAFFMYGEAEKSVVGVPEPLSFDQVPSV